MKRILVGFVCSLLLLASAPTPPVVALSSVPHQQPLPRRAGNYIVVLDGSVARPETVAESEARRVGFQIHMIYRHALNGYSAHLSADALDKVERDPQVAFVVPDVRVSSTAESGTHAANTQILPTGVDRVDGDLSSTASGDGAGSVNINVAVLATGIDATNPDLNVAGGHRCVGPSTVQDVQGEGTALAGVIAARDDGAGVVGLAPGAPLWSVRVLNRRALGTLSQIMCGLDWVTSTRTDADPSNDIAVAVLGFVGLQWDARDCGYASGDVLHLAICASSAAGVTYVAAGGGRTPGQRFGHMAPETYREVLTVTAMTDTDGRPGGSGPGPECPQGAGQIDDVVASFTGYATQPGDARHTVAAPGVCVLTDSPGGGLAYWSGSLLAAAHGAGVVALCVSSGACNGLAPSQIVHKIVNDATSYNEAHPRYGYEGDPAHALAGRYYGWLIRAAKY